MLEMLRQAKAMYWCFRYGFCYYCRAQDWENPCPMCKGTGRNR